MSSNSLILILPILLITAVHFSIPTKSTTHPDDIKLLNLLKTTITKTSIPKSSCIDTWDFNYDPCDTLFSSKFTCGFRCDLITQPNNLSRVTEITLDSPGYTGSISNLPFNLLPYLQNLDLSNNAFTGNVPLSLSNLSLLARLAFSHNSLSGSIPESLGYVSSLQEMYLDNNFLSGNIPKGLNRLSNLKRLELQRNRFDGDMPELGGLGNLAFLDVSDNLITGQIPAVLPPGLVEFVMRGNEVAGSVPRMDVPNLQVLDLSNNKLSGSIPGFLFQHGSLEQLTMSNNRFESVEVPGEAGLTSGLISIDLSGNELRGFLPVFMGLMPRLSALSLENNKFSGWIPAQYVLRVLVPGSGFGQFERLLLSGNYLYGPIPGGFMNLKPGSVMIRLGDNCLYRCPVRFFCCAGGVQKSLQECKAFGPIFT